MSRQWRLFFCLFDCMITSTVKNKQFSGEQKKKELSSSIFDSSYFVWKYSFDWCSQMCSTKLFYLRRRHRMIECHWFGHRRNSRNETCPSGHWWAKWGTVFFFSLQSLSLLPNDFKFLASSFSIRIQLHECFRRKTILCSKNNTIASDVCHAKRKAFRPFFHVNGHT